jgi:hypothetical protein
MGIEDQGFDISSVEAPKEEELKPEEGQVKPEDSVEGSTDTPKSTRRLPGVLGIKRVHGQTTAETVRIKQAGQDWERNQSRNKN